MRKVTLFLLLLFALSVNSFGDNSVNYDDCVHVRVLDCGQGLCCLVKMPGDYYMVYDAGTCGFEEDDQGHDGNHEIRTQLADWMGDETEIDLLVISHAHQDHMNRLPEILGNYSVKRVIRTGVVRSVWWSSNTNEAINAMETAGTLEDINLADFSDIRDNPDEPSDLENYFGQEFTYGDSTITLVCGWNDMSKFSDVYTSSGDLYNSTSIVIRLDYHDRSILFAGDTNGYEEPDDPDALDCITSEKYMYKNSGGLIGCDVLIAGHHGSGGSSSRNFIDAVSPKYVVFSAGHYGIARSNYHHPNWQAARRFYESGVDINNIFRTDFGDNEGSPEWFYGRISDEIEVDPPGDDGVDIWLFPDRERDPYVCWERNDIDPHLRPDDFEF